MTTGRNTPLSPAVPLWLAQRALRQIAVAVLALLPLPPLHAAVSPLPACLSGPPVSLVVRIGDAPPRRAWLRGSAFPPLSVVDAETGQTLWSAAAVPPALQVFEPMRAPFAGSLLPLDLDGDGIHDRIYAGDLGGRVWRFDLRAGNPAATWATGGVFADLSSGAARGFVAPPDVSLPAASAATPIGTVVGADESVWFNIAIGTARLGSASVDNRFYVLRDRSPFDSWTQEQYRRWRPLREVDLVPLRRLGAALDQPAPDGYFIDVGGADILSPSLTVSGRATVALADPGSAARADCAITAVVSSIDLTTGREHDSRIDEGSPPHPASVSLIALQSFSLQRAGSTAECRLGEMRIPQCDVDLSPRRTWWRREDAD